jgi:hypothetical protein
VGTFPNATGNTTVSPSATTTYTLTATGVNGCPPVTLQTTVIVQACPTAAGSQFSSSKTSGTGVAVGESGPIPISLIDLSWNAPNAVRIRIYVDGLCAPGSAGCEPITDTSDSSGSVSVSPKKTTTYVLVVDGAPGCQSFEKRVTVTVGSGGSECSPEAYFQVDGGPFDSKNCPRAGDEISLSWDVPATKGGTVEITDEYGDSYGSYALSGSILVNLTRSTTYFLTVYTDDEGECAQFKLETRAELCP